MRRLAMKKAVCSSTLILPLHPLRSAQFRRCHRQLIVSLFDLGQRLESPSEPQTWAFRSDSVHQQNRIHSMARLTPRTMRIPLDAERLLLAQRNRQQSPQTIHRVRLCDGCGHRESRQSQMSQGSDRGLFAGGRSARGALESRGQAWGPAAESHGGKSRRRGRCRPPLSDRSSRTAKGLGRRSGRCPGPKNMSCCFCRYRTTARTQSRPSRCLLSNFFNECDRCQTPRLVCITLICQSIQFKLCSARLPQAAPFPDNVFRSRCRSAHKTTDSSVVEQSLL